jgi:hypothetical protein
MSTRPLLSAVSDADETTRLRREIVGLERELQEAKDEAAKAKQAAADSIHAIRALRKQTEPLYLALKMIHGEISRVDAEQINTSADSVSTGKLSPKMEMMKRSLGGRQAEFIDFLSHGPMTTAQLSAAGKCHRDTVAQVIHKLTRAGLIDKAGGKFSLRES